MCHSKNFDKIDSFLKPVLNIFILGNLIVGWGEGVINLYLICRFRVGVNNLGGVGFIKVKVDII